MGSARTVVWDTAAIPRDKPPAWRLLGEQGCGPLASLFNDANVICLVGTSSSVQRPTAHVRCSAWVWERPANPYPYRPCSAQRAGNALLAVPLFEDAAPLISYIPAF